MENNPIENATDTNVATNETKKIISVVWDLETTGFVAPECKILEIGAKVIFEDGTAEDKHWVLNNNVEIPEKITEITGITKAIIDSEGRDPKECLNEFLEILQQAPKNITHNGFKFDIPFLIGTIRDILAWGPNELLELETKLKEEAFDTAVIFKGSKLRMTRRQDEKFSSYATKVMNIRSTQKFNLGYACDDLKIDRTGVQQHRALGDVGLTYQLSLKILA
jgi:DNA polymerase III epsilon subunit-like protein